MTSNTTKRPVETFVVAIAGQSAMPTSGTVSDSSTGNVNLANGQLAVVAMSQFGTVAPLTFMDATPTFTENASIAIYQGTSSSANVAGSTATYPLWVRPFEKTQDIDGRNNNIIVTKQDFRLASHNIWTIGVPSSSTTGEINVLDNTEYRLNIGFSSRRYDEFMSTGRQTANLPLSKTTPDFTALGTTAVLARDYIVSHFGYEINRNSNAFLQTNRFTGTDPVVAIAAGIALSGPSGAAAGTAISSITAGDSFAVFNYKGVLRSITITAEMLASLNTAATASGFTHIFTIDLANAGSATGGTATGLYIMALDSKLAYIDRIAEVKNRLFVGLPAGFDYTTVSNVERVGPDEGQGYSRPLDLWYQATAGQRKYTQRHVEDPVINFPSPIVDGQQYVIYQITHGTTHQIDPNNITYSPKKEVILIPRYSTGTTTNPLIALFDTALNTWLPTTGNPVIANIV